MTDLLEDPRFWDGAAVLDEPMAVPVVSDDDRPAYDGHDDDGYEHSDGVR